MNLPYAIFDTEIIGTRKPRFFIGVKARKKKQGFWWHNSADRKAFEKLLLSNQHTWVGFNSENFDRPLLAAALMGYDEHGIKALAEHIIANEMKSWQTYREFKIDFIDYDHIDLIDVAPGVMIGLKTYMGRMGYPTLIDRPFDHTHDLKPSELSIVETYCFNDVGGTEQLLERLQTEIELRNDLSLKYGQDLRSKSDAQIAEAILKTACGLSNKDKSVPMFVRYKTPDFIVSDNPMINEMKSLLEQHRFIINRANGSPEVPEFLSEPVRINAGTYQMGIGGLHSTHDNNLYLEANDNLLLSDFDVASYYPNIMMKAGLIPHLNGKGEAFLSEYKRIYDQRMEAKHAGNKKVANSLKITLNGTFGKLGNLYCSFYSPDLLLAVTITGQLNLLCLIDELEKIRGVKVHSANTDGVLVVYPPATRKRVLKVFAANAKRTGFEYEETPYRQYAAKDVNNYVAIKPDGKTKRKGLYTSTNPQENPLYLMKNPTMEVCTNLALDYLILGIKPEEGINDYKDIKDFVAIRNVKGGGVQHKRIILVDDWEPVEGGWTHPGRTSKPEKRKSRPAPRIVGVDGKPFGRIARWYMTKETLPPITYTKSGNQVPNTEGAKLCLELPKSLPKDLDKMWYVQESYRILRDLGVSDKLFENGDKT